MTVYFSFRTVYFYPDPVFPKTVYFTNKSKIYGLFPKEYSLSMKVYGSFFEKYTLLTTKVKGPFRNDRTV